MKRERLRSIPTSKLTLPDADHDHIQGPTDAPFLLLEYGDYECPHCGEAYPIVRAVQKQLGNRLCFAFRNFPLTTIHPYAAHAAEAAEAAGAQGRFWEMHDLLFENQDALADESLAQYASAVGTDAGRVISEILTGVHTERVREDFRYGSRAGVNGTPTFFINGARYDGEIQADRLIAMFVNSDRSNQTSEEYAGNITKNSPLIVMRQTPSEP
jgi:protein-disulfide isomerase